MVGCVTRKSQGVQRSPCPLLHDLQGRGEEQGLPALPASDPSSRFPQDSSRGLDVPQGGNPCSGKACNEV